MLHPHDIHCRQQKFHGQGNCTKCGPDLILFVLALGATDQLVLIARSHYQRCLVNMLGKTIVVFGAYGDLREGRIWQVLAGYMECNKFCG